MRIKIDSEFLPNSDLHTEPLGRKHKRPNLKSFKLSTHPITLSDLSE